MKNNVKIIFNIYNNMHKLGSLPTRDYSKNPKRFVMVGLSILTVIFTIPYILASTSPGDFLTTYLLGLMGVMMLGGILAFIWAILMIWPPKCKMCRKSAYMSSGARYCKFCRQELKNQLVDHVGTITCKLCNSTTCSYYEFKNHYALVHNNGIEEDGEGSWRTSYLEESGKRMYPPF